MADLILYSNGCPKCRVIKSKLEAKKITFTENNNVEELIPMGIRSLPILKHNDNIMEFCAANTWINQQEAQ